MLGLGWIKLGRTVASVSLRVSSVLERAKLCFSVASTGTCENQNKGKQLWLCHGILWQVLGQGARYVRQVQDSGLGVGLLGTLQMLLC